MQEAKRVDQLQKCEFKGHRNGSPTTRNNGRVIFVSERSCFEYRFRVWNNNILVHLMALSFAPIDLTEQGLDLHRQRPGTCSR